MKIKVEEYKKIYNMYHKEGLSYKSIALKYKVSCSLISDILNVRMNEHGRIMEKKCRYTNYSADFKYMVICEYKADTFLSANDIVKKYNLSNIGILYSWLSKYDKFGYNGLINKKKGRPPMKKTIKHDCSKNSPTKQDHSKSYSDELKKVKYENLMLRAENDFLKKLEALDSERKRKK